MKHGHRLWRWLSCVGLVLILAGCAWLGGAPSGPVRLADTPVARFKLDGRVSVKNESQSYAGSLTWHRAGGEEFLLVSGPLGQGAAEIRRVGGQVVLTGADGSVTTDSDDQKLLTRVLGLSVPLDGLVWWLSALPRPGSDFRTEADGDGRVASLSQDGWRIEYSRYQARAGRWMPGRIFASRDEVQFRLVVDAWEPL